LAIFVVSSVLLIASPAHAQERYHVVKRGENLALIAQQYNVDLRALMDLNDISNANVVYTGQRLLIPMSASAGIYGTPANEEQLPARDGYYVVRRGDSLSQIAQRYTLPMSDLMRLNGINNAGSIYVGQRLRVTARVDPAPAEETLEPQIADNIYVVQADDTLAAIAKQFNTTPQALMSANGLPNGNAIWEGQRLRIRVAPMLDNTLAVAGAPVDGRRWIEVNLTDQTLTAWQGDVAVLHTKISSGTKFTPTVKGHFKVLRKYKSTPMSGPGYSIPNVPWTMYFHGGYAIHGAYWHNKFGQPMSHGCVNVRVDEAELLYNWAPMDTEVYVHD
jgi:LysM repeat protein